MNQITQLRDSNFSPKKHKDRHKVNLLLTAILSLVLTTSFAQNVIIPDAAFKSYLVTSFDKNGDGEIQAAEAEAVSVISANNKGIADATGIEAFVNLTSLYLNDNSLSTIDVSNNPRLTALFLNNSSLTTLDLSSNTELQFLLVEGNQLSMLNLTQQETTLTYLSIGNNPGTSSFDISDLTALLSLVVNSSNLSALDISSNPSISTLSATDNPNLTCVTVADPLRNWKAQAIVDSEVVFTDNCNNPLVVIPDVALSSALLTHTPDIDTNDDGVIRQDEALAFTGVLSLSSLGIEDATGIEAFVNATSIDLSDNSLYRLNLDANTSLTSVDVFENDLHYFSIKNGNNTVITSLDVSDNDNLDCMSVDELAHANANWTFPIATSLSTDCSVSIPDANFKAALLAHVPVIDLNDDDEISLSEATALSGRINVFGKAVADLSGIEAFHNITDLICGNNSLTTLDLSRNLNLIQVQAQSNDLTSFTLGDNKVINYLTLANNDLTSLDVSSYSAMQTLLCNINNLSNLAVPSQINYLSYEGNPVSASFNYTGLTQLTTLIASGTSIPTPDISNLVDLETFTCVGCAIDEIDLSANTKLKSLNLSNNNLESIDLTNNNKVASLSLNGNSITSLDVSNLTGLTLLNAYTNQLTSLNANNGSIIGTLRANSNPDLNCISVSNPEFAEYFSTVDEGVLFYEDCNSIPVEFPDSNFEQALLSHTPVIDANSDGKIQTDEASNFTGALNVSGKSIINPDGLLFFDNASSIDLSGNSIKYFISSIGVLTATSLDLSDNELSLIKLTDVATSSISILTLDNNPNLSCVNVDDLAFANANWTVSGSGVTVSDDCIVNIPDALFKADLTGDNNIDTNDDDEIQLSEAEAYSGTIYTNVVAISDLTGIETFINLNWLNITTANLTEVDLSRNTQLTTLILNKNDISEIDLSKNTMLTTLELGNNELTSLDLSANVLLDRLYLLTNSIENIDLSANDMLTYIELRFNELESINLQNGNNSAITYFMASSNEDLACLDVDDITHFNTNFADDVDQGVIFDTNCSDPLLNITDANFLAALVGYSPSFDTNSDGDIRRSEVTAFSGTLDVSSSSITSLSGIEDFTNLTGLIANDNQIVDLDISKNALLTSLDASDNALESLDVRNGNNANFSSFDVTSNASLTCIEVDYVDYATTNWTSKDAGASFSRYCDGSEEVYIPDSRLKNSLRSNNPGLGTTITYAQAEAAAGTVVISSLTESLIGLEFFPNLKGIFYNNSSSQVFDEFDFTHNLGLEELVVNTGTSSYTTLDISKNTSLKKLTLNNVDLDKIDFTLYPDLEELSLFEFDLDIIDLSSNTQLVEIRLQEVGLTSLNLSANTLLEFVDIHGNPLTTLSLANNTAITSLNISETGITSIDLTALSALEEFRAEEGSLITLDLSQNSSLIWLYAAGSSEEGEPTTFGTLTEVLLPSTATLDDIDLRANRISSIHIPSLGHPNLNLNLEYNELEEITIIRIGGLNAEVDLDYNSLLEINASQVAGTSATVSVTNNMLVEALLSQVNYIDLRDNPDLKCAFVFDPSNAFATYDFDPGLTFSNVSCNITWDGSAWSNTSGPTASDDVLILGDYDFATDGSFECANLRVHALATLLVDNEGTLQVNGEYRNNGATIIESGSSLITFAANDFIDNPVEIRRNTRYADGKYSFVGSPVEQISETTAADLGTNVYTYDEAQSDQEDDLSRWVQTTGTDQIERGRGYTQAFKKELIFEGIPNTGTITYTGSYENDGWHLVSNPYAAAISIIDFLDANMNTTESIYIWDDNNSQSGRGSNSDYIVANRSGALADVSGADNDSRWNNHIGSAQGFFVQLDGSAGDITFTEAMRRSNSNADGNFFRKETSKTPLARIYLKSQDGLQKQALVAWNNDVSDDQLSKGYDAAVFSTKADYAIFTEKADTKLAIQTMTASKMEIPLGINVAEAGTYQIEISFENGYDGSLFLYDALTEEQFDLAQGAYSFSAKSGKVTERFKLLTTSAVLSLDDSKRNIYTFGKTLFINNSKEGITDYQLYNLSGKLILKAQVNGSTQLDLSKLPSGIYLVSDGVSSKKVILK